MTRIRWENRSKFLVTLMASYLVLAACSGSDSAEEPPAPAPRTAERGTMTEKSPIPEAPKPLASVGRAGLIEAAAAAADASASGAPLPAANARLVNRSFEVRLPFGCAGPSADMDVDWAGWTYDPATRALKLAARPENWKESDWLPEVAPSAAFDAVEGFWIHRPWTAAETCPPPPPAEEAAVAVPPEPHPEAVASAGALADLAVEKPPQLGADAEIVAPALPPPPRETLAIARFVPPGAPRTTTRGDRPYAMTVKQPEGFVGDPAGYRLVLSGRITGFRDGQPVHCWNETPALRPVCILAAEFDRVAFEDSRGAVFAEWRQ